VLGVTVAASAGHIRPIRTVAGRRRHVGLRFDSNTKGESARLVKILALGAAMTLGP